MVINWIHEVPFYSHLGNSTTAADLSTTNLCHSTRHDDFSQQIVAQPRDGGLDQTEMDSKQSGGGGSGRSSRLDLEERGDRAPMEMMSEVRSQSSVVLYSSLSLSR
jgi:hypothetical protein